MPSGAKIRFTISSTPPISSAQLPEMPNHLSRACGPSASVVKVPPMMAPETMVMPPT
jgi:hypothetical protein